MLAKILCFLLSTLLASEPHFVIDRGERDIFMNLTSCSNDTPDYCYSMNAEKSKFDQCVCRCLLNYPMYRNPDVFTAGRGEFTSKGKPGCVWHSNHRYECFRIRKVGRGRYSDDEQPLEFDLSKSGSLLAFADRNLSSCTGIETAVKMPEESDFTPKPGLLTAVYKRFNVIRLQWQASAERYAGGILRGVLTGCAGKMNEARRCFVGKIIGVYNGGDCRVRALNGECCIFPFKYNAKVYNDCTTDGSDRPWCAVRLPFFGAKMHWRQNCTNSAKVAPGSLKALQGSPRTNKSN